MELEVLHIGPERWRSRAFRRPSHKPVQRLELGGFNHVYSTFQGARHVGWETQGLI